MCSPPEGWTQCKLGWYSCSFCLDSLHACIAPLRQCLLLSYTVLDLVRVPPYGQDACSRVSWPSSPYFTQHFGRWRCAQAIAERCRGAGSGEAQGGGCRCQTRGEGAKRTTRLGSASLNSGPEHRERPAQFAPKPTTMETTQNAGRILPKPDNQRASTSRDSAAC